MAAMPEKPTEPEEPEAPQEPEEPENPEILETPSTPEPEVEETENGFDQVTEEGWVDPAEEPFETAPSSTCESQVEEGFPTGELV